MLKIAINGYGRIGRNVLRILFERGLNEKIQIVAINDLGSVETLVHLTRFDSTFGRFGSEIKIDGDKMLVGGQSIQLLKISQTKDLPWQELDIDVVLDCTGRIKKRELADEHLAAGAKRVLLAHPLDSADLTVVYGVNHEQLDDQKVVSNASCTTNCLAPLVKILHENFGIEQGLMTTIHAYTNDQNLLDKNHSDLYRARAAAHSMIPTSTGAAKTIGLVIPELSGRLDGLAVRVPTINVSMVDLSFIAQKPVDVASINQALQEGAKQFPAGVFECNEQPLVSCDFNGYPASSVADLKQTRVQGQLVKVLSWYDNEWGFSNRMLDVLLYWHKL